MGHEVYNVQEDGSLQKRTLNSTLASKLSI